MIESLLKHIGNFIPVSEGLKARIASLSKSERVEKGKFIHRPEMKTGKR